MTVKWMRIERDNLLDGIFAVIVVTLLCFFLFEDQLPNSAFGADDLSRHDDVVGSGRDAILRLS